MKFNRINENKLQIILSKEDLAKHHLNKGEFVPYGPEAQIIFAEIMKEAYDACGFEIGQNAQLMIEAFPITGESLLLTVTKVGGAGREGGRNPFDFLGLPKSLMNSIMDAAQDDTTEEFPPLDTPDAVYGFANMDDAIEAIQLYGGEYEGHSQLYRYRDSYFLLLSDEKTLSDSLERILLEYGNRMDVVSQFYQEHGECVIRDNAIGIMLKL